MDKYKFKEDFKDCLLQASDYPGTTKEAQEIRLNELDEVYAKAEAWNVYKKHNLEYGESYYEITREHITNEMDSVIDKYKRGDSE